MAQTAKVPILHGAVTTVLGRGGGHGRGKKRHSGRGGRRK